jgi:phosphomannomutase
MPFIRSISGLRATLGDGLLPFVLSKYAAGFSAMLGDGEIIVGRDGRPSGKWIEQIIISTLTACGRKVRAIGIVPTPTVQLEVEHSNAAGGIAITASHNPGEWNGLKFLNSDGVFLDKSENETLWNHVDNDDFKFSSNEEPAELIIDNGAIGRHVDKIMAIDLLAKNLEALKSSNLKAVVDAVNASGSEAVPSLLEKMGVEAIGLFTDGSGIFPHIPEPLPQNLGQLAESVTEHKADIGISVDPDADRLVLIDENGKPIGEEKTITLSVQAVLSSMENPSEATVCVNYSTSRMVDDVVNSFGANVERSPVGEINVVRKMKDTGAIIGGEGSGGVILPACHYGRDSLVGTALVLSLMAKTGKSLSELSAGIPKYEIIKLKKGFAGELGGLLDKIEEKYAGEDVVRDDGIKVNFEKSWVQLRASNTEPIVRVIAEAPTIEECEKLTSEVMELI